MKVQKILRGQQAGQARYGGVILELEHTARPAGPSELLVSFGDYVLADTTYHEAVQAGATYFFGQYAPTHPGDLLVEVAGIHELPGDTTAPVVQYATILALSEALGWPIAGLGFDWEREELVLPVVTGQLPPA